MRLSVIAWMIAMGLLTVAGCGGNPDYPNSLKGKFTVATDPIAAPLLKACATDFIRGASGGESPKTSTIRKRLTLSGKTRAGEIAMTVLETSANRAVDAVNQKTAGMALVTEDYLDDNIRQNHETYSLARIPLVFSIPANQPISTVRLDDLKKIVQGKITNYRSLGGVNMPVFIYVKSRARSALHLWIRNTLASPQSPARIRNFDEKLPKNLAQRKKGAAILSIGLPDIPGFKPVRIDGKDIHRPDYPLFHTVEGVFRQPRGDTGKPMAAFEKFLKTPTAANIAKSLGCTLLVTRMPVKK